MQLIVAEKNSVGTAIAEVIGGMKKGKDCYENDNYIVTWCNGHMIGLAEPNKYGENLTLPILPDNWLFDVIESKRGLFMTVSKFMNDSRVTEIVCATDAAREGECIFRFVYEKSGCKKPVKRFWTSSLEAASIKSALENMKPDSAYDNLYLAGLCRTKADWLVGMNLSRLYTGLYGFPENPVTHKKTLSYGRVMTPILEMIVEREDKSKNFVKEKYYTVELNCGEFTASSERIDSIDAVNGVVSNCSGSTAVVTSVKREQKSKNPPKLYDLTTLQREANRKYGYSAKETLDCVQSLYEDKLVTYPRTDSCYITDDMESTVKEVFEIVCNYFSFTNNISFVPNIAPLINNAKVSDHHAIIPTKLVQDKNLDELPKTRLNVLNLIVAKLICACAEKYTYESVSALIECGGTEFRLSGRTDINTGWKGILEELEKGLKGDKDEKEADERSIPELSENMTFENVTVQSSEHWTSPPKPYTEDTLLSAMDKAGSNLYDTDEDVEKKGLGTPATRAAAIEKLKNDGYITCEKKQLLSTDFGRKLLTVADNRLKSPILTVEWETKLQKMERGEYSSDVFMQEISDYVSELISSNTTVPEKFKNVFPHEEQKPFVTCPKCNGKVFKGKFGYFCEHSSGADRTCNVSLRYEDNFFKWKNIKLTDNIARDLLTKQKTFVKGMKSKTGKSFDGFIAFDFTGEYANLKVELDNNQSTEEFCKCPKCGGKVIKDKFSYHCEHSTGNNRSCNIYLKKDDNFFTWKGVVLGDKQAKELLTSPKSYFRGLKSKSGSSYNAYISLDYSGQYVQYKMEFEKKDK